MFCWCTLAVAMAVCSAAEANTPPKPAVGQKIGVFNMAKVMRDYDKAKTRVAQLNEQKTRMEANIVGLRGMLAELPQSGPKPLTPMPKKVILNGQELNPPPEIRVASGSNSEEQILLTRLVEDADRKVKRILNDEATEAITELYDDIYAASVAMSEAHGLSVLFAYPDAVTEEERNSAMVKELKLKPPAAQPFFVHPSAEYTDELLARLHGKREAALPKRPAPPKAANGKVPAGTKIGCFNMAAVMRDYGKAKYKVYKLNEKRNEMSKDLIDWRSEYIRLQKQIQDPILLPDIRDTMSKKLLFLARQIEDKDREVNNILNEDATKIISELYDDINAIVTQVAREKGLSVVMAYPDAVTKEERDSAMVKELKLKPPAAQPFYLEPSADYTREVIKRLNNKNPAPAVPAPPPSALPPIPPYPVVVPVSAGFGLLKAEQPEGPFGPPIQPDEKPAKSSAPVNLPPLPKVDGAKPPTPPKEPALPSIPPIPVAKPGKP